MAFDPITGEPIEDSDGESMAFDPMTGEPIKPQPSPEPEIKPQEETGGFDPMTGQPIGRQQPQPEPIQETGGFDPMTGEPIRKQPSPESEIKPQETGGFDPMTGQPIGQQPQQTPIQEAGGFDPMTGQPINTTNGNNNGSKKKKSAMPFLIGGVAVIAVVLFVIVGILSGLFLGKSGKVMLAAANTLKDRPRFVETFEKTFGILSQSKYTIAFSGDADDIKVDGELRTGGKEKQLSLQFKDGSTKFDLTAGIDAKNVSVQMPQLSSYVFVYDYNKAVTGYLEDAFDEDEIEMLNSALKSIVEDTDVKKLSSKLFKICKDELKSIKFVNADEKEFTIDEKDVVCKGYTAVVTSSNMIHIADEMEDLITDEYVSLLSPFMSETMSMGGSVDTEGLIADAFDELRDDLDDMEDIEISFYVYKNKLAGIILEIPDEDAKAELCFQGGDYRMQNMLLKAGDERIRLEGSSDKSKEEFTLRTGSGSNKYTFASLEYTYESGKFTIEFDDGNTKIRGKLTGSHSEVNLAVNDISEYYYAVSPNLNITFKKGAKMEKLDGKEFDLNKADEDACMDLVEDITDKIYDKGYDYLLDLF